MARMSTYKLNYQSDIPIGGSNNTGLYNNFTFKLRGGYDDCFAPNSGITTNTGSCFCPPSNLFKPRVLVAKFAVTTPPPAGTLSRDCATVRFPVALPQEALIRAWVTALKACGAVCVDLEGEEWSVIPPSLGNYTPSGDLFTLNLGVVAPKISGVMSTYDSDGLGTNQKVPIRYEATPIELTGATLGDPPTPGGTFRRCHGAFEDSVACAGRSSISPRKIIIKARGTTAGGGILGIPPSQIVRGLPIELKSDVLTCIRDIGNITGVNCLGWKGESIKRIDQLLV
jgi:hypothetical protein